MPAAGTQRGIATVRYVFDRSVSRFTVQAFSTGLFAAFAHNPTIAFRDYEGDVQFVPETYEKAFVRIAVKTATLEPLDEMKKDDRAKLESIMYGEVLDVERFPQVVYDSKQINVRSSADDMLLVNVSGDVTLRGVTHPQAFDARVLDLKSSIRVSGEFRLRQSDYGIRPVTLAGGALRLKDELKFNFELVARRED